MRTSPAVVITGASKGIGRATALHLDGMGFSVFAGVRTQRDADALHGEATDRLTPVMLDVTKAESIAAAADAVRAGAPQGLVGVVNNAGIVVAGPLEFLPLERIREQFEVNVFGVLAVTQAMLPLIRAGNGRIVNVSSINGRIASPFSGSYAASKFALEAFSDALRQELGHWDIPVVVVQPGAIQTPIWETSTRRATVIMKEMPEEAKKWYGRVMTVLADRAGKAPKHAIPPDRVARVIGKALTARRPRTRYLVGNDARLGALLKTVLPDRLMDRVMTR